MKVIRTATVSQSLNILLKGQLKYLSSFYEVIGLSSSGADLEMVQNREKIRTIAVEMERGISPLKDIISLFRLYWVLKKEKPLIIHSITPKAGLLSMLAGKMAGVPIRIHTFTGLIFPSKKGMMHKLLIKMDQLLCWAATNIYPEGNGVKNDLLAYNITKKPLKVLANGNINGIDLLYFDRQRINQETCDQLKVSLGILPEDFVFIFAGRLVRDKGINELIEAFNKLTNCAVKLLLVGPLESELDPLSPITIHEMKHNPNIISVGFQPDIRPYMAIAHSLVFPSYREGFPNVVIQAGAMELPSIVSNISGCNEIIVEGVNGTIIPVKDADAIRISMLKMMEDKDFYDQTRANARAMIKNRYEQDLVWNAVLNEYNSLVNTLKVDTYVS